MSPGQAGSSFVSPVLEDPADAGNGEQQGDDTPEHVMGGGEDRDRGEDAGRGQGDGPDHGLVRRGEHPGHLPEVRC
jgi:hypothetical protein